MNNSAIGFLLVLVLNLFTGSASAQSGGVYRESGSQSVQNATKGFVLQTREVKVQASQQAGYIGTTSGAAIGGLIGSTLGANTSPALSGILGVLGAALGGLGGKAATDLVGSDSAVEILVETNQNQVIAIVQPLPAPDLQVGQAVWILNEGGKNRIIPAIGRQTANAAPAQGY